MLFSNFLLALRIVDFQSRNFKWNWCGDIVAFVW